jgi:hypothetical protein
MYSLGPSADQDARNNEITAYGTGFSDLVMSSQLAPKICIAIQLLGSRLEASLELTLICWSAISPRSA